jgi:uncharacterized membrane protein YphA (DoxX/SURF4 family)
VNTVLWIVQILLALAFVLAGVMKITQPIPKLMERMKYIESLNPHSLIRVIGALEFLGGVGIILPALTGILPWLTPLAAGGLVLTMLGAMALHVYRRDDFAHYVPSIVLGLLAVFVLYGRLVAVPLS